MHGAGDISKGGQDAKVRRLHVGVRPNQVNWVGQDVGRQQGGQDALGTLKKV